MRQYILHKTFRDRTGNFYWARTAPYPEGELPENITKDPTKVSIIETDTHVAESVLITPVQEIRNLTPAAEHLIPLTPQFVEATPVITTKIDVNTASIEDIKNVKGIAEKTATLIVSNRPYESMADLTTRVKPPLGKTWSDFPFKYGSTPE